MPEMTCASPRAGLACTASLSWARTSSSDGPVAKWTWFRPMQRRPPDRRITGQAEWNVPWTTVSGSFVSSAKESGSRKDAASTVLILWPCVARIKKCDGSVSFTAKAWSVAVCRASLVAGADSKTAVEVWSSLASFAASCSASGLVTGTVVAWVVDSVVWADGMWRRAKRFLSDESTACRISGKVTLRDLSFLHSSLMTVSIS